MITSLEEPRKLFRLFYLVNLTKMHKNIASQRFFRELIRKWRFIAFAKKMARKKMELMYQNMHASYMQMADAFFGGDQINPSIIKEFELFGDNVGMFTGQDVEIEEQTKKQYYTNVDKKYNFTNRVSGRFDDRKSKTITKTYEYQEEVEDIKENNEKENSQTK